MAKIKGLEKILRVGEKDAQQTGINAYTVLLEECGGIDMLEELQNHPKYEIYEKAVKILELYFGAEEEDEASPPQLTSGTIFQFGAKNGQGSTFKGQ